MAHDSLCESVNPLATYRPSMGCQCASRAYKADPLPEPDWTPIWARNTEDEI
jgi:hypothetical protein